MADQGIRRAVQLLHWATLIESEGGPTDSDLLDAFLLRHDEYAFELLVRRHGPLVLGVSRRLLGSAHDAEDAFQAVFLVLVQRGRSIRSRGALGAWLYGVAYRICLKMRARSRQRQDRESAVGSLPERGIEMTAPAGDLPEFLDDEINSLPEKYRVPVVLCELQGLSRREASRVLKLAEGTLSSRLAFARKLLRERLARRGVVLSAGAILTVSAPIAGAVPNRLVMSTVKAASITATGGVTSGVVSTAVLEIKEGMVKAMFATRLKIATAGLLLAAGVVGGWFLLQSQPKTEPEPIVHLADSDVIQKLDGKWRIVEIQGDKEPAPEWLRRTPGHYFSFDGDHFACPILFPGDTKVRFHHDPAASPKTIDLTVELPPRKQKADLPQKEKTETKMLGIYSFEHEQLWVSLDFDGEKESNRPTDFSSIRESRFVVRLERVDPQSPPTTTPAELLGAILYEAQQPSVKLAALDSLAVRCVDLAKAHPKTEEGVVALLWTLANRPKSDAGKTALTLLKDGRLEFATMPALGRCLGMLRGDIGPGDIPNEILQELAESLLTRVRQQPEAPKSAEVLSSIFSVGLRESPNIPPTAAEAAAMIMERWVASPDITHFVEILGRSELTGTGKFESNLRAIIAKNPHARIRVQAQFALATIVNNAGEARQQEARKLYEQLVREYDPKKIDPAWTHAIDQVHQQAKDEIEGLLARGVGGPAPALEGLDLDGKPIKLTDYRGKVVLVSFWATWCGPCMRLIPHERELHQRFSGKPFAIVGVNGDKIEEFDRKLFEKDPLPWRSFQDRRQARTAISSEWKIYAWPTLFLIDQEGIIRRRWIGTPPTEQFDAEIERLVNLAMNKQPQPVKPSDAKKNSGAPHVKHPEGPAAKFIDKIHRGKDGVEAPYVVCVPGDHDTKKALPLVLFLHGSGQIGTDGKLPLSIGLAPAIRQNGKDFGFIAVFPQSHHGSWLADEVDGKRAMAILAEVESEYRTDPKRVYLTGVSMGAEGVWSLAVAHPEKFAAIVPVCGGGDPKTASRIKDIPCWCFHGDSDKVVPVRVSRNMVRALADAGGRPQYQEYPGAGHNCWDQVYSDPELYEWLLRQKRE